MPLHLVKLSVGTDSVADLEDCIKQKLKAQIRQQVRERVAAGAATEKAVTEIWAAPETLAYIRAYVARTLKK